MIDSDLAHIYGYTTSAFNQQVRNNSAKFDEDFRFRLTKEEYQDILRSKNLISKPSLTDCESINSNSSPNLKSNFLISSWGGKRQLPYAFTEQGIYMLMTVLKGKLATEQSKALIRTFKKMKDFIIDNQGFIGSKELLLLSVQTTQNTADIAEIKNDIKDNMVTKADLAKVIHEKGHDDFQRQYPHITFHSRKPVESTTTDTLFLTIKQKTNAYIIVAHRQKIPATK